MGHVLFLRLEFVRGSGRHPRRHLSIYNTYTHTPYSNSLGRPGSFPYLYCMIIVYCTNFLVWGGDLLSGRTSLTT